MTDWGEWYACSQCGALLGAACVALSSGGPEALPPVLCEVPHSGRKRRGRAPAAPRVAAPAASTSAGRRAVRKNQATADAWRAAGRRRTG